MKYHKFVIRSEAEHQLPKTEFFSHLFVALTISNQIIYSQVQCNIDLHKAQLERINYVYIFHFHFSFPSFVRLIDVFLKHF
jgi:hypothetical protein